MKTAAERLIKYVGYDTTADDESATIPSTKGQLAFAEVLAEECREIGLTDVSVSQWGYVYACLPATTGKKVPVIGFIAHMDTSDASSGAGIKPRIVKNYDGGDVSLGGDKLLSPAEFPMLKGRTGKDLIVTDGTTLLGADDKSGIAIILTCAEYLLSRPDIEHGKIMLGFTPDEEIGRGADKFDVEAFGADFAYTLDGGELGEFEIETFCAASAKITIHGKSIHPGTAKGVMINSALFLPEVISAFPPEETPACTEEREGFYHLTSVKAACEKTELEYIIRDHDFELFKKRKAFTASLIDELNRKHGEGRFSLSLNDSYMNMIEILREHPYVTDLARRAIAEVGIEIKEKPVRGGTDGSRLSFMGLPCPNIFTGGYNFHGPYEFACIQEMEKSVEVLVNIATMAVADA